MQIFGLSDEVLWTGGVGVQGSGFQWIDHSAFDFSLWSTGEPDNFLGMLGLVKAEKQTDIMVKECEICFILYPMMCYMEDLALSPLL